MAAQYELLKELLNSGTKLSFGQDFFFKFYQAFLLKDRWMQYINGVGTTLLVTALALALGVVLGSVVALVRVTHDQQRPGHKNAVLGFFNAVCQLYTTIIRGTPMMVQGLLIYYAGFTVLRGMGFETAQANQIWSTFTAGLVTISLNSTAYMMEVLRGGIESIDPGQAEAARSLGLSQWQAMRKVVFPQAIKNSLPAIGNEFIINIKDSSVLCVVGVSDLMFMTRSVAGIYYKGTECYLIAAIVYLFLTYLSSLLLKAITGKMTAPDNTKRHQGNQTVDLGLPSSN